MHRPRHGCLVQNAQGEREKRIEKLVKQHQGHTHGAVVARAFFDNIPRHMAEGRALRQGETQKSAVVAFRANPPEDLLLACLWSRWSAPGEPDLLSFALITDEPPSEVLAAGHDRCVIPLKAENLDAWLNPNPKIFSVHSDCLLTGNP